MDNVRFMYVRNAQYEPIGCVAITINRGKNRAEYGLSMRNPSDAVDDRQRRLPFDRQLAQRLAEMDLSPRSSRLQVPRVYIPNDATMHDITESVLKDIIASGNAPSGAVKFAKRWLQASDIIFG
jgi:hypothetical protein